MIQRSNRADASPCTRVRTIAYARFADIHRPSRSLDPPEARCPSSVAALNQWVGHAIAFEHRYHTADDIKADE